MKHKPRIIIDPAIRFGKPIIAGTRIAVADILDLLRSGYTMQEIPTQYPHITENDVKAALDYSTDLLENPASILKSVSQSESPSLPVSYAS